MTTLRAFWAAMADGPDTLPVSACPALATCPRCNITHGDPGHLCDLCQGQLASRLPPGPTREGRPESRAQLCPLCGGKLRVEVLTLVYPEPGLLRIAECLGRGDSYDERGCRRSRPKPPCGRWRT